MRDISAKRETLRMALGIGAVICDQDTLSLIKKDQLPKGNLLDVARAAGFLSAKNTHNLIPHCHPVSIDAMDIRFEYFDHGDEVPELDCEGDKSGVAIFAEAKSLGRTGIEMEVLTAISVAALTIYDLLKPLDKRVEIGYIKLLKKQGGKSDRDKFVPRSYRVAILVCSDGVSNGTREDKSGKLIRDMVREQEAEIVDHKIVPDEKSLIREALESWVNDDVDFIFSTGGTGLGPRDNTVEVIREISEKEVPGISEAMRTYGGERTPLAMMSRSYAGTLKKTTIIALPGSVNGVRESLEAILPAVFHAREMLEGKGH